MKTFEHIVVLMDDPSEVVQNSIREFIKLNIFEFIEYIKNIHLSENAMLFFKQLKKEIDIEHIPLFIFDEEKSFISSQEDCD